MQIPATANEVHAVIKYQSVYIAFHLIKRDLTDSSTRYYEIGDPKPNNQYIHAELKVANSAVSVSEIKYNNVDKTSDAILFVSYR